MLTLIDLARDAIRKLFATNSITSGKLSSSAHYDGSKATNLLGLHYEKALSSALDELIRQQ